jgi:hypothetical protein
MLTAQCAVGAPSQWTESASSSSGANAQVAAYEHRVASMLLVRFRMYYLSSHSSFFSLKLIMIPISSFLLIATAIRQTLLESMQRYRSSTGRSFPHAFQHHAIDLIRVARAFGLLLLVRHFHDAVQREV